MDLTIYTVSGAPRGWRVLIGLTLKQLNYDIHYLENSKGDLKTPEFRTLSPHGVVPILEADGLILRDSLGILAWLDRRFPERPLFGESAEQAARIWQTTMESCDYLREAINALLHSILVKGIDLPAKGSDAMMALNAASDAMKVECQQLEEGLAHHAYLCGATPTAAEAVVFPEIRLLQRAIDRKGEMMDTLGFGELASSYPNVAAWLERVAGINGMDKTMPIHW